MSSARYFTPPAIAQMLGVDPATVRALLASGELRGFNVARRSCRRPRWRISPDALQEFEKLRAAVQKSEPKRAKRKQVTGKEWF